MPKSSVSVCPIPLEQQPVNEYQQLRDSWFFSWATLGLWQYSWKFFWMGMVSSFLAATVAVDSFSPSRNPGQFLVATIMGSTLIPILALLRLYSAWWYVSDRLSKETVFYEESGWYDGQTWPKPPAMLTRDRLIANFDVAPILRRLIMSFGLSSAILLMGSLLWLLKIL